MRGEQPLQVERGFGQARHRKGHVLDDDRGSDLAHRAHRREHAFAHVPVAGALLRVGREPHGFVGVHAGERRLDGVDLRGKRRRIRCARFDQQRRALRSDLVQRLRQPRLAFHRAQRGAVGELHGGHRFAFQYRHRAARRFQVVEQDQRAGLVGVIGNGAIRDLAQETKRALGPDHQVRKNVDGVREVHQRIEAVAGGVLHLELAADARSQRFIGAYGLAQRGEIADQRLACARRMPRDLPHRGCRATVPSASTTRSPASV